MSGIFLIKIRITFSSSYFYITDIGTKDFDPIVVIT